MWQNFVQDKSRQFPDSLPCAAKTKEPLKTKGSGAETEGFEPSYRDEPINAFRVRRVTAASLRLQDVCLFKKADYILLYIFFEICIEKSQNNFHHKNVNIKFDIFSCFYRFAVLHNTQPVLLYIFTFRQRNSKAATSASLSRPLFSFLCKLFYLFLE